MLGQDRTTAGRRAQSSRAQRRDQGARRAAGAVRATHADLAAAIAALREDLGRVSSALAQHGVGLAQVGTDPLREPRRTNPSTRYRAMEEHFAATGTAVPGAVTMNSTASVQVNLDAGPRRLREPR